MDRQLSPDLQTKLVHLADTMEDAARTFRAEDDAEHLMKPIKLVLTQIELRAVGSQLMSEMEAQVNKEKGTNTNEPIKDEAPF